MSRMQTPAVLLGYFSMLVQQVFINPMPIVNPLASALDMLRALRMRVSRLKVSARPSRAAHAWMRSRDISLRVCVALPILAMPRATPTSVGQPYVGKQYPHVALSPTRRKNGHIHAWKAGFARRGWDYGCGSCIDARHGYFHFVENPVFTHKRRALLPTIGRKPQVFAHDQHPSRKTAIPTSHAGA